MQSKNMRGKCITVKIKTSSFINHTKSKTLMHYIWQAEEIYKEACSILEELELQETIRLIGISVSALKENTLEQMSMF